MSAATCFTNTSMRWAIYAFINDADECKKQFSMVLQQLKWKSKFDSEVVPRMKKGNRYVVAERWGGEGCNNCYLYGRDPLQYNEASDLLHYDCGNHNEDAQRRWMTFEELKNTSCSFDHFKTFEDFEKWDCDRIEKKEREIDAYMEECDRAIEEYYSQWSPQF